MRPVPSNGRPFWAFDPRPGSQHCAAWVSPEEYRFILDRGYALIDDQPARPVLADCHEPSGFLRLLFDEPYRHNPPKLYLIAA